MTCEIDCVSDYGDGEHDSDDGYGYACEYDCNFIMTMSVSVIASVTTLLLRA